MTKLISTNPAKDYTKIGEVTVLLKNNRNSYIKIRKLAKEDTGKLSLLIATALGNDFPYAERTIKQYQKMYSKSYFDKLYRKKKNTIIGAYMGKDLIGGLAVSDQFGGVAFVEWLVVGKDYRGRGVGTALLKAGEKWMLDHKYHYYHLCTETDKNIGFYNNRGLKHIGVHKNSWFGETEHIFSKSLADKPFPEIFK